MGPYDDILHLPHHRSETHPPMAAGDRAAQFAPFAVLNGLDAVLRQAEQQREETEEAIKKDGETG